MYNIDENVGKKHGNKETSFEQLYSWIWKQYRQSRKDSPRSSVYFLKSFETFFALKTSVITNAEAERICKDLQEELEETENQFCMATLVDVFMVVSQHRPQTFSSRYYIRKLGCHNRGLIRLGKKQNLVSLDF